MSDKNQELLKLLELIKDKLDRDREIGEKIEDKIFSIENLDLRAKVIPRNSIEDLMVDLEKRGIIKGVKYLDEDELFEMRKRVPENAKQALELMRIGPCNFNLPDDFNEKYEKIKKEFSDSTLDNPVKDEKPKGTKDKIFTCAEKGNGYFKFYKEGDKILIGGVDSKPFKLLQYMCDPNFGIERTTEAIFEAIKTEKDKKEMEATDYNLLSNKKINKIKLTIKELQKRKGLKGKIKYKFDDQKRKMRLALVG